MSVGVPMKYKFKTILGKKANKELAFEENQKRLKTKYALGNDAADIIVVEKASNVKFILRYIGYGVQLLARIALFTLAVVGGIAILYPLPRKELLEIFWQAITEMKMLVRM